MQGEEAPVLNLHLITLNLLSNIWNGISRLVQPREPQWWDLLYRKHVITTAIHSQLIRYFEQLG